MIKRRNIDLRKYTVEEEEIFKLAANPVEFARHAAGKFLRGLPAEPIVFVVYDQIADCFEVVYPREWRRKKFATDEPWLEGLKQKPWQFSRTQISAESDLTPEQKKSLLHNFDQFHAELVLPLKPYGQFAGAVFVGARLDGEVFTAKDLEFVAKIHQWISGTLWSVLQLYHAVRVGIDDPEVVERVRRNLQNN